MLGLNFCNTIASEFRALLLRFFLIIYTTPSHALVHGTFRVATAGVPPSETEGGAAANTPGGTTAQPAAGGRRGTPRAYSPIVNNVLC